jgi:hypothetical protein
MSVTKLAGKLNNHVVKLMNKLNVTNSKTKTDVNVQLLSAVVMLLNAQNITLKLWIAVVITVKLFKNQLQETTLLVLKVNA